MTMIISSSLSSLFKLCPHKPHHVSCLSTPIKATSQHLFSFFFIFLNLIYTKTKHSFSTSCNMSKLNLFSSLSSTSLSSSSYLTAVDSQKPVNLLLPSLLSPNLIFIFFSPLNKTVNSHLTVLKLLFFSNLSSFFHPLLILFSSSSHLLLIFFSFSSFSSSILLFITFNLFTNFLIFLLSFYFLGLAT